MKIQSIMAGAFCAVASASALALPPGIHDAYSHECYIDAKGDTLPYRMLTPENPVAGIKYPLVVFLHGSGERGSDNEAQLTHGGSVFSNPVNMVKYPAFVIFPQCPADSQWSPYDKELTFNESTPVPEENGTEKALVELIGKIMNDYAVDPERVYITGLSMGGIATFDLACRYPDLFAAAAPMCGAVNPTRLKDAGNIRFLIFHGAADEVVPAMWSRKAYKALRDAGADVEYIEFSGTGHNCWTPALNMPEYLDWLFRQSKSGPADKD